MIEKAMPKHFADFVSTKTCPGILVVSQHAPISQVINDLILIWHAAEAEEYIDTIQTLPL